MEEDPLVARPRSDWSVSTNVNSSSNSRFAFFILTGTCRKSEKRRDNARAARHPTSANWIAAAARPIASAPDMYNYESAALGFRFVYDRDFVSRRE
jgi:hypothetical protein